MGSTQSYDYHWTHHLTGDLAILLFLGISAVILYFVIKRPGDD